MASSSRLSSRAPPGSAHEDDLDLLFRALADRTRRAMLARLAAGPASVTELAQPHAMSLPAVSRHLKVLESARLVRRAVEGRTHRVELDPQALREVGAWVAQYRAFWEGQLDALAEFAATAARRPRGKRT